MHGNEINSTVYLDFSSSKTSVVTARLGSLKADMKLYAFGNITWDCSGSPPPPKCLLVPRPSAVVSVTVTLRL